VSGALKFAFAAVVAAVVETGCLWVLTHSVVLHVSIAFAVAFAAGYLALFAAIGILGASRAKPPLGTQLRTYSLLGIAVLLLVEVIVYVCYDWLGLNLTTTNAAALLAVACWVALGWRVVSGDAT
jgi:hypothetical protein